MTHSLPQTVGGHGKRLLRPHNFYLARKPHDPLVRTKKFKLLRFNLAIIGQHNFEALKLDESKFLGAVLLELDAIWDRRVQVRAIVAARRRDCGPVSSTSPAGSARLRIQYCSSGIYEMSLTQVLIVGTKDSKTSQTLLLESTDLSSDKACSLAKRCETVRQLGSIAILKTQRITACVNGQRCSETHRSWQECRLGHTDKVCFKKRRLREHKVAEEDNVKAESGCGAEQCGSRVHPPYQLTLKIDGRPVALELVTVTLINEKCMPRNVRFNPSKSIVRSYTGQYFNFMGLYTEEVEYKGELFYLKIHTVRRSQQPLDVKVSLCITSHH